LAFSGGRETRGVAALVSFLGGVAYSSGLSHRMGGASGRVARSLHLARRGLDGGIVVFGMGGRAIGNATRGLGRGGRKC